MQIEHLRSWHQTRTRADPNTWCAASKPTLTLISPTLPFTIQFLYIDSENVYRRLLCVTGQIDVVYANFWGLNVTFTHLKPVCSCATVPKRKHVSSQNLFGLYSDSQIRKAYDSHFSILFIPPSLIKELVECEESSPRIVCRVHVPCFFNPWGVWLWFFMSKQQLVTRGVQLVDIFHFLHQGVLWCAYICHWLVQHNCNKWEQKPKSASIQWLTQEIPWILAWRLNGSLSFDILR
jgi:hypothetical protein